jgi:hypothetical protein
MAAPPAKKPARWRKSCVMPRQTEFPALIDAIERVSRKEHGLSPTSIEELQKLTEPIEVMVFATPT